MTASSSPLVTVLMPVYNAAPYLAEAVESILSQTLTDFEFLVVDDGSTDDSVEILRQYNDPRIRIIRNLGNLGIARALNRGLEEAAGRYVARMDADDISRPGRLARQLAFMEANPATGLCGSWVRFFPYPERYTWKLPATSAEIRCRQFHTVGVAHPTVFFRRELFARHGLTYDPAYPLLEDYELWGRALRHTEFANIQEVLLDYRISGSQITTAHRSAQLERAEALRRERVEELGITPSLQERSLHESVVNCRPPGDEHFFERAEEWLLRLIETNRAAGLYDPVLFARQMYELWYGLCASGRGGDRLKRIIGTRILSEAHLPILTFVKHAVACLARREDRGSNV